MELFLLRGLPGSGKSTIATILEERGFTAVSADDYLIDENGQYKYDETLVGGAHTKCKNRVGQLMAEGFCIVVHNTFIVEKQLNPYFKMAANYHYRVHSLIVENYHGNNNEHEVPNKKISLLHKQFKIKLR